MCVVIQRVGKMELEWGNVSGHEAASWFVPRGNEDEGGWCGVGVRCEERKIFA